MLAGTKRVPSTIPALAVNTMSGRPSRGARVSMEAPAALSAPTSVPHCAMARSDSTGTRASIHGLIWYTTLK
jgi:hypothetical protein